MTDLATAPVASHGPADTATADASAWLARLEAALAAADLDAVTALFDDECYWRDLVSFTWNISTQEGRDAIRAMLQARLADTAPSQFRLEGEASQADGVTEAWFTFETRVARGRGHLRLRQGRAWTLLTTMTELKGFEEKKGERRIAGAGLDVFASEPATATGDFGDDIVSLPHVYGTHHIGASTDQAQEAIAAETVRIVREFKETGEVPNVVNLADNTPATHLLVVRHLDRPGVLAHVLNEIKRAQLNVQRMENIVFAGAEAAIGFREGQSEQALLGQLAPDGLAPAALFLLVLLARIEIVGVGQQTVDAFLEKPLLLGQIKIHVRSLN